jgi:hypothetical protein
MTDHRTVAWISLITAIVGLATAVLTAIASLA